MNKLKHTFLYLIMKLKDSMSKLNLSYNNNLTKESNIDNTYQNSKPTKPTNFRFMSAKSKSKLKTKSQGAEDSDPPEMYTSDVLCKNPGECLAKKLKWNK